MENKRQQYLFCFILALIFSVFIPTHANGLEPSYGDWFEDDTFLPVHYHDITDMILHKGDAKKLTGRSDGFQLSSRGESEDNIGQLFKPGIAKIGDDELWRLYFRLGEGRKARMMFGLTADKETASVIESKDYSKTPLTLKNMFVFIYGRTGDNDTLTDYYTDAAYLDSKGEMHALVEKDGIASPGPLYLPPMNELGSNSVFFQNYLNLVIPEKITHYSKNMIEERNVFRSPLWRPSTTDAFEFSKTSKTELTRAVEFEYTDDKENFIFASWVYGFLPVQIKVSKEDAKKYIGGEEFSITLESMVEGRKEGEGNKFIVMDEDIYDGKKNVDKTIVDAEGQVVRKEEPFNLKIGVGAYEKKGTKEISAYIPNFPGARLTLSLVDSFGIKKTENGHNVLSEANTGERIPIEDVFNYNVLEEAISKTRVNKYGEIADESLISPGALATKKYNDAVFEYLYLDENDNGRLDAEEKKTDKRKEITEGVYLLEVDNEGSEFIYQNKFIIQLYKENGEERYFTKIIKMDNEGVFKRYDRFSPIFTNEIIPETNKGIGISEDTKTFDLGNLYLEKNMIANEAHFKIFDMKGNTPLLEEGEWTVVQLLKENDAYRFGEAMFNERGRSLKVKNGEFQFDFHIPIDEDEETVYLLYKKNGEKGKKLQDGYFVLRVLPDNPSMILRQNYEYAYKIYKETEGDKEAKLDGISNGGIDFEGLSTDAFTSEEQRMKSYGLFSNFGGTLTADYEDIPQIYRTSISSDLTYYPKGVYPSSKADASPPTIEMLEASKSDDMSLVQRYDFSSMIEKKNLEQISQPNAPKFGYQVDSQGTEINYWIPLYDDTSKVNQKDYLQTDSVRKGLPIQWIIGGVLLVLVIGFGVYLILTNRKGGEKNEK